MEKYTFTKSKKPQEFTCKHCGKDKKSKNAAVNDRGRTLCNGCYGLLLSKGLISK